MKKNFFHSLHDKKRIIFQKMLAVSKLYFYALSFGTNTFSKNSFLHLWESVFIWSYICMSKYYLSKRSQRENKINAWVISLDSLKVAVQNVLFTFSFSSLFVLEKSVSFWMSHPRMSFLLLSLWISRQMNKLDASNLYVCTGME